MNKIMLFGLVAGLAAFAVGAANASDGGLYNEITTTRTSVRYDTVYYAPAPRPAPAPAVRPCGQRCAETPFAVKTHSEVINHYQVYQPVTIYKPAGTFAERVIVPAERTCNRCGY
jgi:hypothetical protein